MYQNLRYRRLSDLFAAQYPQHDGFRVFSAPGRIEIAGNHTDHQGGRVICASVDIDVVAFAAPNNDRIVRIKSEGYSSFDEIDISDLEPVSTEKGTSAALIRGVAAGLRNKGYSIGGFDAYTTSDIPKGSGLSSSAAFEILVATIFNYFFNEASVPMLEVARISQFAENEYFGKPSGLMDQCGCAFGGIMMIDFRDKDAPLVRPLMIDFSKSGYCPVITDTKGDHSDLTGEYSSVPADMKKAAACFGADILSQVDPLLFSSHLADVVSGAGESAALRAMHFFAENERVVEQAVYLEKGDYNNFLRSVSESGISSWTLLRNIFPASHPDRLQVAIGLAASAEYLGSRGACRVHGGGFAGTIQAFVPEEMTDGYIRRMDELFGAGASKVVRIRDIPASEYFF